MHPQTQGTPPTADTESRDALRALIRDEALTIAFQPIVDLRTGDVAGYEALTRPVPESGFSNPGALYDLAEQVGLLDDLESLARRTALAMVGASDSTALLFLNNAPPTFTSDEYVKSLATQVEAAGVPAHRIVLEITERTAQSFIEGLAPRSMELRERGFSIALDDVGAGISGLNQIMSLRPNWIKLDLQLVSDIDFDPLKQNLIRFFVHFAKLGNMNLVAEGIEREEELRSLIDLGVSHGQGYFLGRPGGHGVEIEPGKRRLIEDLRLSSELRHIHDSSTIRVASLATPVMMRDVADDLAGVRDGLLGQAHHAGVVLLDDHRFVGWIARGDVLDPAVPGGTMGDLTSRDCPLVGADVTLAEALDILATRPDEQQALPLVVQHEGRVCGTVAVRQILSAAAEANRRAPSHVAPLTGLPSRVQADRWIASRIAAQDPCDIAMIDLRDFDAYNVAYGFEKGDEMLKRLVTLVRRRVVNGGPAANFFAHLGEDRFMLALPNGGQEALLALMADFEICHGEFFSSGDLAAQAFRCGDPLRSDRTYPLTTIRVIYLAAALLDADDPRDLYALAGRLRLRSRQTEDPLRHELIFDMRKRADEKRKSA